MAIDRQGKLTEEEISNGEAATSIICEEMLDISIADDLRVILLEALDAKRPVALDGAVVGRADTAALQVLAAFFQDARSRGISVHWTSSSQALTRAAALLGVADILDLQVEVA